MLALAGRLMESGQLVNYLRAADLSQGLVKLYERSFPYLAEVMPTRGRQKAPEGARSEFSIARTLRTLWLTLVLAGWLLIGVLGVTAIWLPRLFGYELIDAGSFGAPGVVVLLAARGIRAANSGG